MTIRETNSRKATINSLQNSDKKELTVSLVITKISKPKAKNIDIAMIGADAYYIVYHLKRAQVFTISIKNI